MKNSLTCVLLENLTTRVTYSGTGLRSKFTKVKGKTVKEHQHDIVYGVKCRENQCSENYIGGSAQRLWERLLKNYVRDAKSHRVRYVIKNISKYHKYPKIEDLTLV